MKRDRFLSVCTIALPVAAAILSALPGVVRMNWMGGRVTYCSAYSMVPVGYAMCGPFLAAVAAIVLTVLGVVLACRKTAELRVAMWIVALAAALCGLSAAIFGNLTPLGGLVSLILALDAAVVHQIRMPD